MPESPRYLLTSGDTAGAQKILERVSKANGVQLPPGNLIKEPEVPRGKVTDLLIPKYRLTSGLLAVLWWVNLKSILTLQPICRASVMHLCCCQIIFMSLIFLLKTLFDTDMKIEISMTIMFLL